MAKALACPDSATWAKLLQGRLAEPESQEAEAHSLECDACFETLRGLEAADTLIETLRNMKTTPEMPSALMDTLIDDLCRLKPASASGSQTPVTAAESEGDESLDFLEPGQRPGELGRLGFYRVLERLGSGGMGVVFLAEDALLHRKVALKTLLPRFAAHAAAKERFLREARAAAAIEHEHIIAIHQVGEDRGIPYLAMPLLQGMPLDRYLKDRAEQAATRGHGAALPAAEVYRIGRQIARGLAAAHARGLIHRDIKPANIWLEGDERKVKILDFGLARAESDQTNLTQSGAILGTPAYMAPEQARGDNPDPRADLFSLGCILYEMSTGERPFRGRDTMAILTSLAVDDPPPPSAINPDVPRGLSDLIMRLLAKKAADRPRSAEDVVRVLQELESSSFVPAADASATASRRRRNLGAGLAAVVVVVTLAGILYWKLPERAANTGDDGPGGPPNTPLSQRPRTTAIQTGFNDVSGINSNEAPNSPFALGDLTGGGAGEPGWLAPWSASAGAHVQKTVVFEGDQAMRIDPIAGAQRALATTATSIISIEQHVRFEPGYRLVAYADQEGFDQFALERQAMVWHADGGFFAVQDGLGDASRGPMLDTKIRCEPGTWYHVKSVIDIKSRSWKFYVDGVLFDAGHPLGFRGSPIYLNRIRYLAEGSGATYIDAIRITVTPE